MILRYHSELILSKTTPAHLSKKKKVDYFQILFFQKNLMQTVYKNSRSDFCICLKEGAEDFSLQDTVYKLIFVVKIKSFSIYPNKDYLTNEK